jgi:hypothetical protein
MPQQPAGPAEELAEPPPPPPVVLTKGAVYYLQPVNILSPASKEPTTYAGGNLWSRRKSAPSSGQSSSFAGDCSQTDDTSDPGSEKPSSFMSNNSRSTSGLYGHAVVYLGDPNWRDPAFAGTMATVIAFTHKPAAESLPVRPAPQLVRQQRQERRERERKKRERIIETMLMKLQKRETAMEKHKAKMGDSQRRKDEGKIQEIREALRRMEEEYGGEEDEEDDEDEDEGEEDEEDEEIQLTVPFTDPGTFLCLTSSSVIVEKMRWHEFDNKILRSELTERDWCLLERQDSIPDIINLTGGRSQRPSGKPDERGGGGNNGGGNDGGNQGGAAGGGAGHQSGGGGGIDGANPKRPHSGGPQKRRTSPRKPHQTKGGGAEPAGAREFDEQLEAQRRVDKWRQAVETVS